jgi:hypothetical protein
MNDNDTARTTRYDSGPAGTGAATADAKRDHDTQEKKHGTGIAALFPDRTSAHRAVKELKHEHFHHIWSGVTSLAQTRGGDTTVTVADADAFSPLRSQTIAEALAAHGIPPERARELEPSIDPGDVIVVVEPKDERHTADISAILERLGGRVIGTNAYGASTLARGGAAQPGSTIADFNSGDDDFPVDAYYEEVIIVSPR